MAFEIYYTSAPEGLRPGDRGFGTVAATPGIPRVLWDRLEAMSGYRHLPDSAARPSPVSLAHWLIHLDGRELHVLSRVGDAGLDYSQRTNSLAHHLVLEPAELAAGGPAWMLGQYGVMLDRWDGRVGTIERAARLPNGDQSPQPCRTWQQMTGDAGWAGVVAEAIAKTPWKPVCLVFNPEQELLPLVSEVVALLPAGQRWQATFNTYFTSLPGGVTCQWRCCLANTPAAAAAVRAAANGVVIDLANPSAMGSPPAGAWVEAARYGRMMAAAAKPPPAAGKPAYAPAKGKPVPPPMVHRPPPQPIPLKLQLANPAPAPVIIPRRSTASQPTWNLDGPAPKPEASWIAEQRRARRRRILIIYGLATAIIGIGVWLQMSAYRASSERPLPPPTPPAVVLPPPAIIVVPPPPPETRPVTYPSPPTSLPTAAIALPAPPVVVAVRLPPREIVLTDYLPAPGNDAGIRAVQHTIAIPQDQLDDRDAITSLALEFPGGSGKKNWAYKQDDLNGTFTVKPLGNKSSPGITLFWQDKPRMGLPDEVASITLDKTHWQLGIRFSASLLLTRVKVASLGYWVLQNSTLILGDRADARPQPIRFALFATKPLPLRQAKLDVSFPVDLPASAKITLDKTLPDGWQEAKEPADGAGLQLEKPPAQNGVTPGFIVRLDAAKFQLTNDLPGKIVAAKADLQHIEADQRDVEDEMQQICDAYQQNTTAPEDGIKDWTAPQKQREANPQASDVTAEEIQKNLDKAKKDLADLHARLETELRPLNAQRATYIEQTKTKRAVFDAYDQLKEVDLTVELPQGLKAGTVRLVHDGD